MYQKRCIKIEKCSQMYENVSKCAKKNPNELRCYQTRQQLCVLEILHFYLRLQKQKNFPNHSFFQVFCASAFWLLKLVLPTWQNAFSYSPLSQLGRAEDRWWRKYENIGKNGTKSRKAAFVERYHFAKITNHPPKAISRPMRFAWRLGGITSRSTAAIYIFSDTAY